MEQANWHVVQWKMGELLAGRKNAWFRASERELIDYAAIFFWMD